ncbi:MAG: hypothetical protein ACM4AI_16115 [Acidobacteriota bacterium]
MSTLRSRHAAIVPAPVRRAEFDALTGRVTALEAAQVGRAGIDAYDSALLLAIGEHSRGEAWRCADAIGWAATSPALRRALCEVDVDNKTSLGLWCRKMVNRPVGDVVLRRVSREAGGRLWRVVLCR